MSKPKHDWFYSPDWDTVARRHWDELEISRAQKAFAKRVPDILLAKQSDEFLWIESANTWCIASQTYSDEDSHGNRTTVHRHWLLSLGDSALALFEEWDQAICFGHPRYGDSDGWQIPESTELSEADAFRWWKTHFDITPSNLLSESSLKA